MIKYINEGNIIKAYFSSEPNCAAVESISNYICNTYNISDIIHLRDTVYKIKLIEDLTRSPIIGISNINKEDAKEDLYNKLENYRNKIINNTIEEELGNG